MSETVAYRLEARGPFHFGERGIGIEGSSVILHSDTIFSAICLTLLQLGFDLEKFLETFPRWEKGAFFSNSQPLRLTSAFPFINSVYFFPKPQIHMQGIGEDDRPYLGKTLKRIEFVSKGILEKIISGKDVGEDILKSGEKGKSLRSELLLQGGKMLISKEEVANLNIFQQGIWNETVAPRVTIDRLTSRSEIYGVGQVRFRKGSGLFFIIEYLDPSWRKPVEKALHILEDEGIGGERSSGHGQFTLIIDDQIQLPQASAEKDRYRMLLSLYWPTPDEVDQKITENARYKLVSRRGWIGSLEGSNLRSQSVKMFAEGSVFNGIPRGSLVDVTPGAVDLAKGKLHNIWRNGLAYSLPVINEEAGNAEV
jgi:CRISPR-associated protein Csm4